jgi:hypothetical protein
MADLQDLYPEIRRSIKQCPEPTMDDALLRAARTFCAETWVLRRPFSFTCVAGQQQYQVQAPPNEETIAIKHAQITDLAPDSPISPLRFVYPAMVNPNAGQQRPFGICFVPYAAVALVPKPDNAYPVEVELVTQPTVGTQCIADELGRRFDRAIGYGALEWILRMPGDPWYNPPGADEYLRLFNQEVVRARGEAAFDFTPNQRRWIGAGFARRR